MSKSLFKTNGNVLFLILLAVALFAALSYTITSSSRSGGEPISKEKAKLAASELIQHAVQIEQSIMRMRLSGVQDHQFNFANARTYLSLGNVNCADNSCKLFHPEGGGISAHDLSDDIFDLTTVTGMGSNAKKYYFETMQILNVGTEADELVLRWLSINEQVCNEINRNFDIDVSTPLTTEVVTGMQTYRGTFTAFPEGTAVVGDDEPRLAGKRTFCVFTNNAGVSNIFYHVLIAR